MALLSALRTVRGVNTTVIGKPAAHARSLATGYLRTAFLLGALAAVSAAAAWMIGGQALLIFALAAVVLLAVASERWQRYGRARVGVKAEETVLRAVRRSGEAHTVLNGMLLGAGGDADHIVLGPGAAVIETKAGFGKLSSETAASTQGRGRWVRTRSARFAGRPRPHPAFSGSRCCPSSASRTLREAFKG